MELLWSYILDNLLPLLTIAGGGIAWVVDRKKQKSELDRLKSENKLTEANALTGMQAVYDAFVKDVETQFNDFKYQITELKLKLSDAEQERLKMVKRIAELEHQTIKDQVLIQALKEKIESYKLMLEDS